MRSLFHAGADPSTECPDGPSALDLAQRDGRTATVELLQIALLDGKEGGADQEVDGGAEEPAVRSPPMIRIWGSSWFVVPLTQPLSCVRTLCDAATAADASLRRSARLGPLFGVMADHDMVDGPRLISGRDRDGR
jgi:hypothetical protein